MEGEEGQECGRRDVKEKTEDEIAEGMEVRSVGGRVSENDNFFFQAEDGIRSRFT